MRAASRRSAFSLIELLAVLAVIAVLLGLMLPALASVRKSSRTVLCISNLRQMAIAAQRYALEYQYFPPAIRYESDGTVINIAWDWVTQDGAVISPGPLWQFSDDPDRVQQCPGYHGPSNFPGDPHTGYNYNTTHVGGESRFPHLGWDHFYPGVRYSACRRTTTIAMFGDGGYVSGANKFMRSPLSSTKPYLKLPEVYGGGQAFRHQKATIVAYLDGHVGLARNPFKGALATEALLTDNMDYPRNGFLSEDDRAYDPR